MYLKLIHQEHFLELRCVQKSEMCVLEYVKKDEWIDNKKVCDPMTYQKIMKTKIRDDNDISCSNIDASEIIYEVQ